MKDYLRIADVKRLLDRETINLMNIAIIGMIFYPRRVKNRRQLIAELYWINEIIGIRKVLNYIDLRRIKSLIVRVAYFLLKHKKYLLVCGCLGLRNKLKQLQK